MQTTEQSKVQICETEPQSLIGAVQPHGLLVAFDSKGTIGHVSANFGMFLQQAKPLPGWNISTYIAGEELEKLRKLTADNGGGAVHTTIILRDGDFRPSFHCHSFDVDGILVCEFEPATDESGSQPAAAAYDGSLQAAAIAGSVKEITGFDRVMICKFNSDWSSEVVVDLHNPDMDSFSGIKQQASDIPEEARNFLMKNRSRLIADVNAIPAKLISIKRIPLDLAQSTLRAASATDREHLRNMQLASSFTLPLQSDGRLSGVISCHHRQPNLLPVPTRTLCETLAQAVSPKF